MFLTVKLVEYCQVYCPLGVRTVVSPPPSVLMATCFAYTYLLSQFVFVFCCFFHSFFFLITAQVAVLLTCALIS